MSVKQFVMFGAGVQADPTIAAFNGCTALDLATLVDTKDSQLVRQLATRTIQVVLHVRGLLRPIPLLLICFDPIESFVHSTCILFLS